MTWRATYARPLGEELAEAMGAARRAASGLGGGGGAGGGGGGEDGGGGGGETGPVQGQLSPMVVSALVALSFVGYSLATWLGLADIDIAATSSNATRSLVS